MVRGISVEGKTARQVMVVVLIGIALWLAVQLRVLIVDVIVAITIASAISPLAVMGERRGIPRAATVALTYVLVFAFYATILYLLWAPIKEQALLLVDHLPGYVDTVTDWYAKQMTGFGLDGNLAIKESDVRNVGQMILNRTMDVSFGLIGVLLNVVLTLFLAIYFVVNATEIWTGILSWVPIEKRAHVSALIGPVGSRMGGYVRGQLLVSTVVATFFALGLSLIGVKYGLVLGLVAGVLNLVPFVGSMITTALALVIAVNQSMVTAALTLGLFALEQTLESNFIVPYLLGSQVELNPLVVLFAVLIGAALGGAVGALIAVPVTAALLQIAREMYLKPMQESESLAAPPIIT